LCFLKDPFREARLIADDSVRRALDSIDYTSDPSLNVPDKYKHMVWFTLPIDVALMMVKQKEIGQEMSCDINSIPFMPAEARVNSMTIQINFLIFYLGTTEYSIEIK